MQQRIVRARTAYMIFDQLSDIFFHLKCCFEYKYYYFFLKTISQNTNNFFFVITFGRGHQQVNEMSDTLQHPIEIFLLLPVNRTNL